jgi:hypothetical protein
MQRACEKRRNERPAKTVSFARRRDRAPQRHMSLSPRRCLSEERHWDNLFQSEKSK